VDVPTTRPLWRRSAAPFAAAGLLSFAAAPVTASPADHPSATVAAAILAVALSALLLVAGRFGWPPVVRTTSILGFCAVIGLLRHGGGGANSGYAILVMLPVLWFALYGSRRDVALALAAAMTTLALPIVLYGAPDYPVSEWRRVLVGLVVGPLAGLTINQLVRDRAALLARVEELARTDALTGALNRRAWDEAVQRELLLLRRSGKPVVVALLDLDHFKAYNDAHGHPAGDILLRDAVAAWQLELRGADMLARYGGEEFAVLLPGCDHDRAQAVLDRLRTATPGGQTCSAGWTHVRPADDPASATARADDALYAAKAAGRDRVVAAAA
jgi:diguanylate cyclase (GGDEF)-like protein